MNIRAASEHSGEHTGGPAAPFPSSGAVAGARGCGNAPGPATVCALLVLLSAPFLAHGESRAAAQEVSAADTARISTVLDEFHRAASVADEDAYFGLFAEGGVFIGTDAGERWTVEQFRDYARPYFERGQGWTYVPRVRHVDLSPDGGTAWFDEMLENAGLGLTRGSGVLVRVEGAWRIAQYHLTIPIPNEIAGEVVEMIRAQGN